MKSLSVLILFQVLFSIWLVKAQSINSVGCASTLPDSMKILWLSESIYNTGDIQTILHNLNPQVAFTNQCMTFGANRIGLGTNVP